MAQLFFGMQIQAKKTFNYISLQIKRMKHFSDSEIAGSDSVFP